MKTQDKLDCMIYVHTEKSAQELASFVAELLKGSATQRFSRFFVSFPSGEIEVRRNEDADDLKASTRPDGFLFFRLALEAYPSPNASRQSRVQSTASVLEGLWNLKIPAVAACDYEDDLPNRGGYGNTFLPWPSQKVASQVEKVT